MEKPIRILHVLGGVGLAILNGETEIFPLNLGEGDEVGIGQVVGEIAVGSKKKDKLILHRGGAVLRVEYQGEQDITRFLPRFAEMIDSL